MSPRSLLFGVSLALVSFTKDSAAEPSEALPRDVALRLDFRMDQTDLRLAHGVRRIADSFGGVLEFTNALQYAELTFARKLDAIEAATIGGWFYPRRAGEGAWMFRGVPEIAPLGERRFVPAKDWVNFMLGTDQRGFFMACLNGNGEMPFPLVTLEEPRINAWHQLVLVKDAEGGQKFYHNGTLVHSDADSCWAGKVWPFHDTADGEPLRLAMPQGGFIGEVWVAKRALAAAEITAEDRKSTRLNSSH